MHLYLLCFILGGLVGSVGIVAFFCLIFLAIDDKKPQDDQRSRRKATDFVRREIDLTYH